MATVDGASTGPLFEVGQLVCLRAEPTRQGPVIEVLPPIGGQARYRVFHAATEVREYVEDQLSPIGGPSRQDPVSEALAKGQWEPAPAFRARLTAARLAHPLVDNLYAL